jgi:hypothetical protein
MRARARTHTHTHARTHARTHTRTLPTTHTPAPTHPAAAAAWVAYSMWARLSAGLSPIVSGGMLALSGALAAFCLYNAAAGGNPPPSGKEE